MIKSERYTSRRLNQGKFELVKSIDLQVKDLKNRMSLFCKNNIFELVNDNDFWSNYKPFKNSFITAHETQTIFQDIIKYYKNACAVMIQNEDFGIQTGMDIRYYTRNTKHHKKGELKSFGLQKKQTHLTMLVKCMTFLKEGEVLPEELQGIYDHFKNKKIEECVNPEFLRKQEEEAKRRREEERKRKKSKNNKSNDDEPAIARLTIEQRIVNLVEMTRKRLQSKCKLIEFTTGTYRKSYSESGNKDKEGNKIMYSGLMKDDTNACNKHWFKYRTPDESIYLPLDINEKYHHFDEIRKTEYYVKTNEKTIDIIGIRDVENPDFQDFKRCEGIDINVKNNFCAISDGKVFDYDRQYIEDFVEYLKKLDEIGMKNISDSQRKRLNKMVRRNEWYFKKLIADIIGYLVENGITDIVLEDLHNFGKTFIMNDEFGIKYSRLVRLLRLSSIKDWFSSQAEKHGIRVHLTSPCYSSQQCPVCGAIHKENRTTQENFICIECGHSANADINAAINLRKRFTSDVLRGKLHNHDEFGRMFPKKLRKEAIKEILLES